MPITAMGGKKGTRVQSYLSLDTEKNQGPSLHRRKVLFAKVHTACRASSTVPTHQNF